VLGLSLVQISPAKCGVSECCLEGSIMRRPWPTRVCCAMGGISKYFKIGAIVIRLKNAMLVVGVE
jgi:phage shock protein PspC (stress-responsive transcriptional regulator)